MSIINSTDAILSAQDGNGVYMYPVYTNERYYAPSVAYNNSARIITRAAREFCRIILSGIIMVPISRGCIDARVAVRLSNRAIRLYNHGREIRRPLDI